MTATSVTGRGLGSAVPNNKGSEHTSMGVEKLIGPRVVAADSVALVGGAKVIKLPLLDGVVGDYIVTATDATAAAAVSAVLTFTADSTTVTLAGTGTDVIQWSIIKKGLSV